MRISRLGLLIAPLAVVLVGCATTYNDTKSATYGVPSTRQDIEAHDWILGKGSTISIVRPENPATFSLTGDTATGMAPCNSYRAAVDLHNDSIRISDIAHAQRSCGRAVDNAEQAFFSALAGVTDASVSDDVLRLTNEHGLRLEFDRFDPGKVLEAQWKIVNYAMTDGITTPAPGTSATVTFHQDDKLTLETDCTTTQSSWKLEGDLLTIGHLRRAQRQRCTNSEEDASQEAAIRSALNAAHRVEPNPRTLTILDSQGRIVLIGARKVSG